LLKRGVEISLATLVETLRQVGSDIGSLIAVGQAAWWFIKNATSRPDLSDLEGSYIGWVKNQPGHEDYGVTLTITASATLFGKKSYTVSGESHMRGKLIVKKVMRNGPDNSSIQMLFKYTRYKFARGVIFMNVSPDGNGLEGAFVAWGALDNFRPTHGRVEFTSIHVHVEATASPVGLTRSV
jgi:hypothetical protein